MANLPQPVFIASQPRPSTAEQLLLMFASQAPAALGGLLARRDAAKQAEMQGNAALPLIMQMNAAGQIDPAVIAGFQQLEPGAQLRAAPQFLENAQRMLQTQQSVEVGRAQVRASDQAAAASAAQMKLAQNADTRAGETHALDVERMRTENVMKNFEQAHQAEVAELERRMAEAQIAAQEAAARRDAGSLAVAQGQLALAQAEAKERRGVMVLEALTNERTAMQGLTSTLVGLGNGLAPARALASAMRYGTPKLPNDAELKAYIETALDGGNYNLFNAVREGLINAAAEAGFAMTPRQADIFDQYLEASNGSAQAAMDAMAPKLQPEERGLAAVYLSLAAGQPVKAPDVQSGGRLKALLQRFFERMPHQTPVPGRTLGGG